MTKKRPLKTYNVNFTTRYGTETSRFINAVSPAHAKRKAYSLIGLFLVEIGDVTFHDFCYTNKGGRIYV